MANYKVKNGVGIIPKGKTTVESPAFQGRTDLTSVIIPESVMRIEESAFEGCIGLKDRKSVV